MAGKAASCQPVMPFPDLGGKGLILTEANGNILRNGCGSSHFWTSGVWFYVVYLLFKKVTFSSSIFGSLFRNKKCIPFGETVGITDE